MEDINYVYQVESVRELKDLERSLTLLFSRYEIRGNNRVIVYKEEGRVILQPEIAEFDKGNIGRIDLKKPMVPGFFESASPEKVRFMIGEQKEEELDVVKFEVNYNSSSSVIGGASIDGRITQPGTTDTNAGRNLVQLIDANSYLVTLDIDSGYRYTLTLGK